MTNHHPPLNGHIHKFYFISGWCLVIHPFKELSLDLIILSRVSRHKLSFDQCFVIATFLKELLVGSTFDNETFLQDNDLVGIFDGR